MKLAKSLLLGSAAGLMAVAGANAADLPVRAAAPAVDYVRVCNAHGVGFFFIPGTETCLRVSGRVRWEGQFNETANIGTPASRLTTPGDRARGQNSFTQVTRAEVNFDTRTATEFGLLRTFTKLQANTGGGAFNMVEGYIQFGNLTAGRAATFFSVAGGGALGLVNHTAYRGGINVRGGTEVDMLGYSMQFGTVSVDLALQQPQRPATATTGLNTFRNAAGTSLTQAGTGLPDLVGRVVYSAGGFRVGVAGALTELRTNLAGANPGNKYGWAIKGAVSAAVTPATTFTVQATYADGALWYANVSDVGFRLASLPTADAVVDGNRMRTSTAWSIYGNVAQQWTPQLLQNVFASYGKVTPPAVGRPAHQRFESWQLGTNLNYAIVPGLTLGAEVKYSAVRANREGRPLTARRDDSRWDATLRIQRDF